MSSRISHADEHVDELLPAYVNATLDADEVARVRVHLARCSACREELALWTAIAGASQAYAATLPADTPSLALLERVWSEDDAPMSVHVRQGVRRRARRMWAVARGQVALLPKGIWPVSAAAVAFGILAMLLMNRSVYTPTLLGFIVPLVTAAGVAFIYGGEHDPALEIALSTPLSPRLILASRLAIVFGYNFCLGLLGTLLLMALRGGDFTLLVSLWAGPMLLLAGVSLLLTVVASTVAGMTAAIGLWGLHLLTAVFTEPGNAADKLFGQDTFVWHTNPIVLMLAVALLALALLAVPRQEHLLEA
jgi:hypothetical protein